MVAHYLFTADEFQRAYDLGIFSVDTKLELIEGEIIQKMPQTPRHAWAIRAAHNYLEAAFTVGHDVRGQLPLLFEPYGKPEPDVAVVIGSNHDYKDKYPTTAVMVVEISDSTLPMDRTTKAELYARAGIGEYWIVNVVDNQIEVHRDPVAMEELPLGCGYQTITHHMGSDTISPLAAPNALIAASDLLP